MAYPVEKDIYASPRQASFAQPPTSPGHALAPSPDPLSMSTLNDNLPDSLSNGAPPVSHFINEHNADDFGQFNGGAYSISHRDTNPILTVQLAIGAPIHAKSGAMLAMSPSVTCQGEVKFSVKKLIAGGHMAVSHYTGPGEVILAPHGLGDITALRLTGNESWSASKNAFLAHTDRVVVDYKAQDLAKTLFSGEGWFTFKISGTGILWLTSLGAILRKDIGDGEQYIVDNGHLVAWNCGYVIKRAVSGGIVSGLAAGEGFVCKFTGPGTVFMQTRNATALSAFLSGQLPHGGSSRGLNLKAG